MTALIWTRTKKKILALALSLLFIAGVLGGLELFFYRKAKQGGWLERWEYLTVGDPELGFRLRPGIRIRWYRTDVAVNRSGFRDRTMQGDVLPRQAGELLIAAIGDSVTFGACVPFRYTYPVLLQRSLARRLHRPVRVVNLGVPGYSSLQAMLTLKRWMHLQPDIVVFTECFNDRAQARPDSRQVFREEFSRVRPYELGSLISFTLLHWHWFRLGPPQREPLPLDQPLPQVRLPRQRIPRVLGRIVDLCEQMKARLYLVAIGGDARVEEMTRDGMRHVRRGMWRDAERVFDQLVKLRPGWYLNWHYLHEARTRLADSTGARSLTAPYRALVSTDYLGGFSHYSCEYVDKMRSVARARGVELIDMREPFSRNQVRFHDVAHFGPKGHGLLARALAEKIAAEK